MLAGDAPVSMVILLDTSYSMEATGAGQSSSHFENAVDAACAIIEGTSRGSEISVIQTGGAPTPLFDQPVFDSAAVVRRVRALQAGYGASDMQQALDAGLATLAGMSHARRELIVISDFQPSDWTTASKAADAIRQQVNSMAVKPELSLLQVGEAVVGNVSIESLDFSNRPLGVGQQLSVRANLRNHGEIAASNARVILKVDGQEQSVSQVSLAANTTTQTLFPCTFEQPGSHVIEVEVLVDDPLQTDNKFAAAVTIWDQIDVLLVDGDPSSEPLKSETDFLAVALTPYSFGRMKLTDLVNTKTVSYQSNLNAEFEARPRVIVLANVPRLTDAQANELQRYVESGGALLVCAGNRLETAWYNKHLFERGLLPAEFGVPRGKIDDKGQSSRIVTQRFDHPALQFFNDASNGDLSTAEIRQWYELKLSADTSPILTSVTSLNADDDDDDEQKTTVAAPIVMARLDNGDPLLIESTVGEGVVVQLATSSDADWCDLPMRPFYVPLMQQLVTTMATQFAPPKNIQTGEPAVALFAIDSAADGEPADYSVSIAAPDGSRRNLRSTLQGNQQMVRFDGTRRPGVYTMISPDATAIHFVASTSREESNLEILNDQGLMNLAEQMAAQTIESPATYLEQDRLRRHGREIWEYVLMALLAFMFLELVLQQTFSRVRT